MRVGRLELCEVRSRTKGDPVHPAWTINRKKLERVRRATAMWLREQKLGRVRVRIDAAAVTFDGPYGEPRVEYYENVSYPMRGG